MVLAAAGTNGTLFPQRFSFGKSAIHFLAGAQI
jgi:hypothetical protein